MHGSSGQLVRQARLPGPLPQTERWCHHSLKCSALNAVSNIGPVLHTALIVMWIWSPSFPCQSRKLTNGLEYWQKRDLFGTLTHRFRPPFRWTLLDGSSHALYLLERMAWQLLLRKLKPAKFRTKVVVYAEPLRHSTRKRVSDSRWRSQSS
jgi:hypothetical protein